MSDDVDRDNPFSRPGTYTRGKRAFVLISHRPPTEEERSPYVEKVPGNERLIKPLEPR